MTSADVQLINISFAKARTWSRGTCNFVAHTNYPKHSARLTIIKHSDVRESADLGTEKRKKNWYNYTFVYI